MTRPRVSDEVWRQLDPNAGRLSRRHRRHVVVAFAAVVAIVALAVVVRQSGALGPRLSAGGGWHGVFDPSQHTFTESARVQNDGWQSVRVVGSASASPGVRVTGASGLPADVPAGAAVTITVYYAVTNCADVRSGWVPIVVRVDRWWGTATVRLAPMSAGSGGPASSACNAP